MREPSSQRRFRRHSSPVLCSAIIFFTIPLLLGSPEVSSAGRSATVVRPSGRESAAAIDWRPRAVIGDIRGRGNLFGDRDGIESASLFSLVAQQAGFPSAFGSSDTDAEEVIHTLLYQDNPFATRESTHGLWSQDTGNSTGFADLFRQVYRGFPSDTGDAPLTEPDSISWGYLLPIVRLKADQPGATGSIRITMPPVFTAALAGGTTSQTFGGIDYSDPNHVGVPLLRVAGHDQMHVSPSFLVRDFATHDNAPLARIAPGLVLGLERVTQDAGRIHVISGYRHRSYNASVGGARFGRHISGQAADIWSPTRSSLDLAQRVIGAMGCNIGIGLGRNTLHVDVRGTLATWTYPGAPLSERAFDLWVRMLCGGQPFDRLFDAIEINWMAADSMSLELGLTVERSETPEEWIRRMGSELAAYAELAWLREGPGAVIIDFTQGVPPAEARLGGVVRYVALDAPEVEAYRLRNLINWVMTRESLNYFAYAAELVDGSIVYGIANLSVDSSEVYDRPTTQQDPTSSTVPPGTYSSSSNQSAYPSAQEARQGQFDRTENPPATTLDSNPTGAVPPAQSAGNPAPGWVIVVGSFTDAVGAEEAANQYRRSLESTSLNVTYRLDTSGGAPQYRITVGYFGTAAEAERALRANAGSLPSDAWLLPVSQ